MNLDERCITCGYARGEHKTLKLGWSQRQKDGTMKDVSFWQEGLCPDSHNMQQPSWDMYLFHGPDSGWPYEDVAFKIAHPKKED